VEYASFPWIKHSDSSGNLRHCSEGDHVKHLNSHDTLFRSSDLG